MEDAAEQLEVVGDDDEAAECDEREQPRPPRDRGRDRSRPRLRSRQRRATEDTVGDSCRRQAAAELVEGVRAPMPSASANAASVQPSLFGSHKGARAAPITT